MNIYKRQSLNILFYAKTPYQLLIMSYLALTFKQEENCKLNLILIIDAPLDKCWQNYDKSIWNDVICRKLTFYPDTSYTKVKYLAEYLGYFFHDKYEKINLSNYLYSQNNNLNYFFFSNGDDILVPLILEKYPGCISYCVSEGSASYNIGQLNGSKLKRMIKLTLLNFYNILHGGPFLTDGVFNIEGGENVNGYIDTRIDKATERFKQKRILYEIALSDLTQKSKQIIQLPKEFECKIKNKPKALFMTGCLSEDSDIDESDELDFYQKVILTFQKKGFQVFIKPHPREKNKKINKLKMHINDVVFLDRMQSIPAEVLFTRIKFQALCGILTSAIWNGYDLGVSEKYFMLPFLYKQSGGYKRFDINAINNEIRFQNNVFYPESWEEFQKQLNFK